MAPLAKPGQARPGQVRPGPAWPRHEYTHLGDSQARQFVVGVASGILSSTNRLTLSFCVFLRYKKVEIEGTGPLQKDPG